MANDYSTLTERLVEELSAGLADRYAGLVVDRRHWAPARLPDFTRYAVVISPAERPIEERRIAVPQIQYILRANVYALVRNWSEPFPEQALWGTDEGALGLFEFVMDIKTLLRLSDLDGLLDKTYDEAAGDARSPGQGGGAVEYGALIPGFTGAEYAMVYPARLPYVARIKPFCHPRL